jgi:transposase
MSPAKQYYKRARISEEKFSELLICFAKDLSATETALITGLTRKTVTSIFLRFRQRIVKENDLALALTGLGRNQDGLSCKTCLCGWCHPMVPRSVPVFGLLNLEGKILSIPFPDCRTPILRALVRGRLTVRSASVDGWHGYDALVDAHHPEPLLLFHESYRTRSTGQQIESFWKFTQERLQKFYGISNRTFYLHLKESEWRFNLQARDVVEALFDLLEQDPI